MKQRRKQVLASIFLFVFVLYYANISLFYHSHHINELIISHSHFHGSSHAKTETHSSSELSLIDALSAFQSLQVVVYCAGIGLFLTCLTIFRIGTEQKQRFVTPRYSHLRAPPAIF